MLLERIAGTSPLVLVAPHGGRRDPARRPWGSTRLRMNDLHTAPLTRELAAATGAAALVNATGDRNDVDLARISAAHDHAPGLLDALAELVEAALARHGHAVVLTVHGWNVIEPRVDVGLGCLPGATPLDVAPEAAVTPAFAAHGVGALLAACAARDIHATVGARYPARARENLVQLFTSRHADDARPRVRRLVALAARTQALQLELGVPLRWPGPWRARFVDAVVAALPALAVPGAGARPPAAGPAATPPPAPRRRALEIAGAEFAGLVATDAGGARLLLFPRDGGLLVFTGERAGHADADRVGGLHVRDDGDGLRVAYTGPLARFADTRPFLDLEDGLARSRVVADAQVALRFAPDHPRDGHGGEFGRVVGSVTLDGRVHPVRAHGFAGDGPAATPWPRLRLALRLGAGDGLALTVGTADGAVAGFHCAGDRHVALAGADLRLGPPDDPLAGFAVDARTVEGRRVHVEARAVHRLPVVRGASAPPVRVLWAACRVAGADEPAGWCELGGH